MKPIFLIILIGYSAWTSAQNLPETDIDISSVVDELLGKQELDLNYELLYDNLVQALSSPINLNKASAEDLEFLKILMPAQITSLIEYRRENGSLLSIYELQAVPGFDAQTITRMAPFVKIVDAKATIDASLLKRIKLESENYLLIRTAFETAGSKDTTGSADKTYVRFRSSRPGDFSFGFTSEKDSGEPYRWDMSGHYYGVDYWSLHAQVQNKQRLKNLIVGDYQAQFGQGLMLGGVFGTGKGSETITAVRRSNIGFIPYTSSYESGNLRGIAASFDVGHQVTMSSFYSRTRRDASGSDTLDYITNLQATGLHRTAKEFASRQAIINSNYGCVVAYNSHTLECGIMYNHYDFSRIVTPRPSPFNQFAFDGRSNDNIGMFLNYNAGNICVFSEMAYSINADLSFLAGSLMSLSPVFDLSVVIRNYQNRFYTQYSNAFGENSLPQNERGIYWGWKYKINRRLSLAGYFDLFKSPWLKYRTYMPSEGYEWLLRLSYQPSRNVNIFLQCREESKQRNLQQDDWPLYRVVPYKRLSYWLQCETGVRDKLRLKTRLQAGSFNIAGRAAFGFVVAQDIRLDLARFQFTGRYALFDTDDYDTRQYMYENDVLLALSMPAYFGKGVRKMVMMRYKINRYLSLWVRYGTTTFHVPEKMELNRDINNQNLKNDIKFQVQIQF